MLYDKRWDAKLPAATEQWRLDLLAAADSIERFGWRQGGCGVKDGPRRAIGAIAAVTGDGRPDRILNDKRYTAANERLCEFIKVPPHHIPEWNDEPRQTQEKVVAEMRRCARLTTG